MPSIIWLFELFMLEGFLDFAVDIPFCCLQAQNASYDKELRETQQRLALKLSEIKNLAEELDKVKSVLQQKVLRGKPDILPFIQVTS